MRTSITRGVAPTMPLSRLAEFVRARGLHGIELAGSDLEEARALGEALGRVVGVYVESIEDVRSEATMRAAAALGAPVIAAHGVVSLDAIPALDAAYLAAGAELLVTHRTDVEEAATLAAALDEAGAKATFTAWEVHPGEDALTDSPAILMVSEAALRHVRLEGGGPELRDEDAPSTGGLFTALALSRYGGAVALMPSDASRVPEWEAWLDGKIRNGCGTAHEKKKLRDEVMNPKLDIRPVLPKNRLDTILSAYRELRPGKTLHVTFDHDPSCMYYMLEATEPAGSFVFEKKGDGPEVWYADVTKSAG